MLLKEATLCKTRVVLQGSDLRLSSFPHPIVHCKRPHSTLRVQRKVTNLCLQGSGEYFVSFAFFLLYMYAARANTTVS